MSIKTQIDRISGEVTTQAELIAQIQNAVQGKAGAINYRVYIGETEPTADVGNDGDIYIMRSVTS